MLEQLQAFSKSVEGRTVFILGGGPSVTPPIIDYLQDKKVFCINSSIKFIHNPIGVLWCDMGWASQNSNILDNTKCAKFSVQRNAKYYLEKQIYGMNKSIVLNKEGDFGFSSNIASVCGNNSGANAINLLVNCNVRRIGLIGFDMKAAGNRSHFHQDYDYAIRPTIYKDLFVPSIESMIPYINVSNTKIFNCTPDSALTCFEYRNYKKIK